MYQQHAAFCFRSIFETCLQTSIKFLKTGVGPKNQLTVIDPPEDPSESTRLSRLFFAPSNGSFGGGDEKPHAGEVFMANGDHSSQGHRASGMKCTRTAAVVVVGVGVAGVCAALLWEGRNNADKIYQTAR